MDIIKKEGAYNGLLHILLLRMASHVAKQLGMPPGGEFRRAFEEVSMYNKDMMINLFRNIIILGKTCTKLYCPSG